MSKEQDKELELRYGRGAYRGDDGHIYKNDRWLGERVIDEYPDLEEKDKGSVLKGYYISREKTLDNLLKSNVLWLIITGIVSYVLNELGSGEAISKTGFGQVFGNGADIIYISIIANYFYALIMSYGALTYIQETKAKKNIILNILIMNYLIISAIQVGFLVIAIKGTSGIFYQ